MKTTHYRRCHKCGEVNEAEEGRVGQCHNCETYLAPFYYFDDRFTPVHSDSKVRPEKTLVDYRPILGITAYWDNFEHVDFKNNQSK